MDMFKQAIAAIAERVTKEVNMGFIRRLLEYRDGLCTTDRYAKKRKTNPSPITHQRPSRKIANTPLKLVTKNQLKKSKKKVVEKIVKKEEEKLAEKDDNLAVESKLVVTKLKPGKTAAKKSFQSKPKVAKEAKAPAADRAAYSPPAPKFIIKQAGQLYIPVFS